MILKKIFTGSKEFILHHINALEKTSEKWTDEELVPIKKVGYDEKNSAAVIWFLNGDKKIIRFN